jgi:hypothetical protein
MYNITDPSILDTYSTSVTLDNTLNTFPSSYVFANPFTGNHTGSIVSINNSTAHPSLQVSGDADFNGDIKIRGTSLKNTLEEIQARLAILVPDPEKLEHFEALKKAYQQYKTLEALCELPKKEN